MADRRTYRAASEAMKPRVSEANTIGLGLNSRLDAQRTSETQGSRSLPAAVQPTRLDRRIKTSVYVGMCFCPNCGVPGSIFEVYRRTPPRPWRLHEYRVLHHLSANENPCYSLHGPVPVYCRLSPRLPFAFWFSNRNSMLGGGWLKRSMIQNNEYSLEQALRREFDEMGPEGPKFFPDYDLLREFLMPQGRR